MFSNPALHGTRTHESGREEAKENPLRPVAGLNPRVRPVRPPLPEMPSAADPYLHLYELGQMAPKTATHFNKPHNKVAPV